MCWHNMSLGELLCLALLCAVQLKGIVCQMYSSYELQHPDKGSDDYGLEGYDGGDYGGYGGPDYVINIPEYTLEKIEPEPVKQDCYTCTFHKLSYHEYGFPNCDDPFKADDIPVVACDGLCAKTKSMSGEKEYILTRSCLPNCQTMYSDTVYTECCFGNLCNGARNKASSVLQVSYGWVILLGPVLAMLTTK